MSDGASDGMTGFGLPPGPEDGLIDLKKGVVPADTPPGPRAARLAWANAIHRGALVVFAEGELYHGEVGVFLRKGDTWEPAVRRYRVSDLGEEYARP